MVNKGVTFTREKKFRDAFKCFEEAVEVHPDCADAFVGFGALYANEKRYKEAMGEFDKALAIDPEHANARLYAGKCREKMEEMEREERKREEERERERERERRREKERERERKREMERRNDEEIMGFRSSLSSASSTPPSLKSFAHSSYSVSTPPPSVPLPPSSHRKSKDKLRDLVMSEKKRKRKKEKKKEKHSKEREEKERRKRRKKMRESKGTSSTSSASSSDSDERTKRRERKEKKRKEGKLSISDIRGITKKERHIYDDDDEYFNAPTSPTPYQSPSPRHRDEYGREREKRNLMDRKRDLLSEGRGREVSNV